ncbi:integrase core domain-containing protein [Spirochaeta cellobiosiphila]
MGYRKGIELIFSRLGEQTDNCHIESFFGTLRYGCLDANHFSSIKNARQ